eukprot:TRINITY_DN1892_c0_g1_i1.p1 TRINITY_DN1892_c0_g1~~TRINITY_DN1892_c0_g1_i1.p1  ORF type:complete len:224 (+),score=99.41 TRINITY_DN1892_c0_g1_i1:64-735(+)
MSSGFMDWLFKSLEGLECDRDILIPFIVTLLEDEDEVDNEAELIESLDSVLSSMIPPGQGPNSAEIFTKWSSLVGLEAEEKKKKGASAKDPLDLSAALNEIAESKSTAYRESTKRGPANTDADVKAAILAGYAQQQEEAENEEEEEGTGKGGAGGGGGEAEELSKNTNAEGVAQADSEKREKARASAAAKKEKDKEDRENQKKNQEDRKKKAQEKAAKGERRR